MTIKKGNVGKGKGKDISKTQVKNEVSSSTSKTMDLTRKSSTSSMKHEVVSSSSTLQESKNVTASEKRTNTVEMSSSSREIIMDADGKIIKVIENKPTTVVQTASTSKSGKSSQDLIADEQRQIVRERSDNERSKIIQDENITSTERGHQIMHESNESFDTSQNFDKNYQISRATPTSYSRSIESSESKRIITEGHTKDGQTITSTIRIDQSGQRVDDNGQVTSTTSHNIDSDITMDDSKKINKLNRLKIDDSTSTSSFQEENFTSLKDLKVSSTDTTDYARRDSDRLDHSPVRYTKPGDSTWDGKFILEKPESKKKTVSYDLRDSKSTESTSKFTTEKKIDIQDSKSQETNIRSIIRDSPSPTRRVTRPGDSTWDGHFTYEKPQEKRINDLTVVRKTAKRNDSVEVQDVTEDNNLTQESLSSSYIIEYNTEGDKKIEKVTSVSDVIIEEEDAPTRKPKEAPRTYRLGESTWDGKFIYEKPLPQKRTPDIRRVDKRSETVDIREVTEDNSINEADVSTTSYLIEHTASDKSLFDDRSKNVKTIFVEVEGQETPKRPQSPDKSRTTKPGSSTWDGTFVMERSPTTKKTPGPEDKYPPQKYDQRKFESVRKKNISDTTLDLTEDEVLHSSFIIQKSSTHESYSDSKNDFTTSSTETVVIQDGQTNILDQNSIKLITGDKFEYEPTEHKLMITRPRADDSPTPAPEKRPTSEERSIRPTKPGSSTWDGSFTYEKPFSKKPDSKEPDSKRPHSKEPDSKRPDSKEPKLPLDRTTKFDSLNTTREKSTIESRTYDSSNIDTSTYEIKIEKSPKLQPRSEKTKSPEDKTSPDRTTNRAQRPTKPGSSNWDGSFTYEKPQEKRPSDTRRPSNDDRKPLREKPHPKYDNSNTTIEKSTFESKTYDSNISTYDTNISTIDTNISSIDKNIDTTKFEKTPKVQPRTEKLYPKDDTLDKSPDRTTNRAPRPTKPGSSNWDGSFTYEKPQDKKPNDNRRPSNEKRIPINLDEKYPKDNNLPDTIDRRSSITKDIVSSTTKHDVIDSQNIISDTDNTTVTSDIMQQTFVIEKSSSSIEVQDFRNIVDNRVINEFTKDVRQDQVS